MIAENLEQVVEMQTAKIAEMAEDYKKLKKEKRALENKIDGIKALLLYDYEHTCPLCNTWRK